MKSKLNSIEQSYGRDLYQELSVPKMPLKNNYDDVEKFLNTIQNVDSPHKERLFVDYCLMRAAVIHNLKAA